MSRFGEMLAKYGDMSNEERQQLLRQLEDDGVFGFPILFHAARLTYQVEEYRDSPPGVRLKALYELRQDTINRNEVLSEDHQEMTHAAHAGQPSRDKSEEGLRRVDQHIADLNAILEFIDEGIKRLERHSENSEDSRGADRPRDHKAREGHSQEPRRWSVIESRSGGMANKKQAARKSAGGRDAPPQTHRTAQELSESYNRFFRVWSGMSQDMGNQVSQNLKKQQAMYDDFFGRWNKLSAEVGSRLSRERANEGVREFYHVWKNYASKIGPRLQKAVTEGLQGYDTVTHSLDKYTRKMKERTQGLLAKPEEPRSLDDLYGAWQEFGTSIRKQMQGAMGQGLVEADELTRTWLDFSNRMDKLVSDVGAQGADYADLAELWQKFSKEIASSLMSVVNGTGKDMDGLQKTWNDYYSKVEREMVQLASDVGMSYQQLYIRFFEQRSEALNSLGQWWQTAVETTRKQLADMQRRP